MRVRAVRLVFRSGLVLTGLIPADVSDEELALEPDSVEVLFTKLHEVSAEISLADALYHIAAATYAKEFH